MYISVSRSGEIARPRCSKSSPVLATTVRSSRRDDAASPSASLAPPMPPDSASDQSAVRRRSSEQILVRRPDQRGGRSGPRRPVQPAHQHDRPRPRRPAPSAASRRGDLVGEADYAGAQRAAEQVGPAAQIASAGKPAAPIATPTVPRRHARPKLSLMMTPTRTPIAPRQRRRAARGRGIGVARQQQHRARVVRRRRWSDRRRHWP